MIDMKIYENKLIYENIMKYKIINSSLKKKDK